MGPTKPLQQAQHLTNESGLFPGNLNQLPTKSEQITSNNPIHGLKWLTGIHPLILPSGPTKGSSRGRTRGRSSRFTLPGIVQPPKSGPEVEALAYGWSFHLRLGQKPMIKVV